MDAVSWLPTVIALSAESTVVVTGDSHLVIAFMARKYRPAKPELFRRVSKAREVIATLWGRAKVHYVHVKRHRNAWADWLCRCALASECDVCIRELAIPLPKYHLYEPTELVAKAG